MPDGQVLEFSGVTKRFGAVTAVSGLSARVEPGVVTGFLGPNGAGKTTSLRILLGLVGATSGAATIGGVAYSKLKHPLQSVGAVLEASSFHPGRTAANHLKVYAQAAKLPNSRVDEALAMVGLAEVAGRKVGGYSLGMRQRLGLAYALLGDPGVLVLDEPSNGLDPEGIVWMRGLLRQLAKQGRTVLVSSHMLAEVQQTVDALLIISQGRLVFQGGLNELSDPSDYAVVVDSPDRAALSAALKSADVGFEVLRSGLTVRHAEPAYVGAIAADAGVALSWLQRRGPALEEVFLDLVNGVRVHESAIGAGAVAVAAAAEVEPDAAEPGGAALGAAAVVGAAALGEQESGDDGATVESGFDTPAEHAAFAVASTGVVEVITDDEPGEAGEVEAGGPAEPGGADEPREADGADEPREADEPAEDEPGEAHATDDDGTWTTSDATPSEETDAEPPATDSDDGTWSEPANEPAGDAEVDPEPAHEGADDEPASAAWAMPAAAADIAAAGSDDEPSADEGEPAAGEESADESTAYEKTEADLEADRFFAAFTADEAAAAADRAEQGAGAESSEPGESESPPEPDPEPEPEPEPEPDPEPEPEPEREAEREADTGAEWEGGEQR